jgi:MinD-like ATPase involved in chromosome partitioning or flagellar assembly
MKRTGRDGQIISFYSFKGGVGRSMALANVAALLCRAGHAVLVVDWDLEAPGLHKFFEQSSPLLKSEINIRPGVLDAICELRAGREFDLQKCVVDVALGEQDLHLISAGRRDENYAARLQRLEWDILYKECNIGQAFEDTRERWKNSYDYVLLDSRTGVTDIGDVCTALFPDILVPVFVANEQNIEGTKLIIERARAVHAQLPRDRAKLVVVPLIGRDESFTEYELSSSWRTRISNELGFTLSDWLPTAVDAETYFQKVFIPYYSYWSFGENLPVIQQEREISNPASISAAYARLASLIENGLDWKVLEKGVDAAEINSLRSRASANETKSAELERKLKWRQRFVAALGGATVLVSVVGSGVIYYRERQLSENQTDATIQYLLEALKKLDETRVKVDEQRALSAAQISAARKDFEESRQQIAQEKAALAGQVTDLQQQNKELLEKLTRTTEQLGGQNSATQQKLDEILKKEK